MKKYLIYIAAALMALSCTDSAVDPLSDAYPQPPAYSLTKLTASGRTKDENGKFHFPLSVSSQAGDQLNLVLVADSYFIPAATFTGNTADKAKAGNYISDESSFAPVGENAEALNTEGTLSVVKAEDHYSISGYLWTVKGRAFRVEAAFDAVFEPEKEAGRMDVLAGTKAMENSVVVYIASGEISSSPDLSGNPSFKGDGKVLMMELSSSDGKLHPGTYTVGAEAKAGDFWSYEYAPGMLYTGGSGTNWFDVKADGYSFTNIKSGVINVSKSGSIYDIEYKDESSQTWVAYTGPIEDLDYEVIEYVTLSKFVDMTQGKGTVTLSLATEGIEAAYNESTYSWSFSGKGQHVSLELYSEDGKLAEGLYKACATPGIVGNGEFGTGYKFDYEYAPGMFWPLDMGSTWFSLCGEETKTYITDGTVSVSYEGEVCTLTLESGAANAKYIGKLSL